MVFHQKYVGMLCCMQFIRHRCPNGPSRLAANNTALTNQFTHYNCQPVSSCIDHLTDFGARLGGQVWLPIAWIREEYKFGDIHCPLTILKEKYCCSLSPLIACHMWIVVFRLFNLCPFPTLIMKFKVCYVQKTVCANHFDHWE